MTAGIATQLAAIRKNAGLTQTNIAVALELGTSYVSLLEANKRNLDLELFVRWCRVCNQDPAVVLTAGLSRLEGREELDDS